MPVKTAEALERQREHNRLYKRAYRASTEPAALAYRDREQRRLSKRHGAKWALDPARYEGIMCDGEATDTGVYDLLNFYSSSLGMRRMVRQDGIQLGEYVGQALRHKKDIRRITGKRSDLVFYAQGYDHEKMVLQSAGLTDSERVQLARQKSRGYGAIMVEGKEQLEMDLPALHMHAYIGKKTGRFLPYDYEGKPYGRVSYMDIHSFFNTSFVKAVEKFCTLWTAEERALYERLFDLIKEGKEARENWESHGFNDEKRQMYNQAELVLTNWLFETVRKLCMEVAIYPASLAGPAPLARALIKKYGVESHLKPADYDTVEYQHSPWNMVCRRAFKAGWIELFLQGVLHRFIEYDVSSAYPHQITLLPCCAHGVARQLTKAELRDALTQHPYAIYHVSWACPSGSRFGPFAVRAPSGGIYRPLCGQDWVYASELLAFQEAGPQGARYNVHDAWEWSPECYEQHPFAEMVTDAFAQRERLISEGNPAEYIIKLAVNSLYGIMAQCAGARRVVNEEGETIGYKTPKYSNLFAAGFITAGTRAQLYRAAMADQEKVIAVATDALVTFEPVPALDAECPPTKVLGTFERKVVDESTIFIAAGVHFGPSGKHNKLRGFPTGEESYNLFLDAWEREEMEVVLKERRYQNILRCAHKTGEDAEGNPTYTLGPEVGTFQEEDRKQNISPNVLASKRDVLHEPTWYTNAWGHYRYFPPYENMQLGEATIYMRPMDAGKQYVPDGIDRVEPDG